MIDPDLLPAGAHYCICACLQRVHVRGLEWWCSVEQRWVRCTCDLTREQAP